MLNADNEYIWIRPSESLPKDQQECLITIKTYDDKLKVVKARFNEDFCYWKDNGFAYEKIVVAWMPCPEPFEE